MIPSPRCRSLSSPLNPIAAAHTADNTCVELIVAATGPIAIASAIDIEIAAAEPITAAHVADSAVVKHIVAAAEPIAVANAINIAAAEPIVAAVAAVYVACRRVSPGLVWIHNGKDFGINKEAATCP